MTNAFVYCWSDLKTKKLYIGSHKGTIDDGYICSSKLMIEQYALRPLDFMRQIIAVGSFEDMRRFEALLLNKFDVAKDPSFYNMHNGNGKFYLKNHTEKAKTAIGSKNKGRVREDLVLRNLVDNVAKRPEVRAKISLNHVDVVGTNNPMFGRKHSKQAKELMSQNQKNKGKQPKSFETRQKMAAARKLWWASR